MVNAPRCFDRGILIPREAGIMGVAMPYVLAFTTALAEMLASPNGSFHT